MATPSNAIGWPIKQSSNQFPDYPITQFMITPC